MPIRYDSDSDSDTHSRSDSDSKDQHDRGHGDREISLGTGTVLAIFFALALVCSLFFGLGYSMGKKSVPLSPVASAAHAVAASEDLGKPSPGTPSTSRKPSFASAFRPDLQVVQPMEQTSTSPGTVPATSSAKPVTPKPTRTERPAAQPAPIETAPPPAAGSGPQSFVQVAAVSRKEDADLLLAALKHRGYTGLVRQQPPDKLLHIQVGPFPSKKDAELMRQRLIVDGYTPILK